MRKLLFFFLFLLSSQVFAYEMHMSCSGKDTWVEVWSFTGGKNVEIRVNNEVFMAPMSSFENQSSLMKHDDSNHPWVYETYLEKKNGSWKINKYWLCLGYYFEEKGCFDDELKLQSSIDLKCHETYE